jgi:hypothetical protein
MTPPSLFKGFSSLTSNSDIFTKVKDFQAGRKTICYQPTNYNYTQEVEKEIILSV